MANENFLKRKKVTTGLSLFALVAGFLFLDNQITGNVILDNNPGFNLISFIGLLLIICSVVLAFYTLKKR